MDVYDSEEVEAQCFLGGNWEVNKIVRRLPVALQKFFTLFNSQHERFET